MQTLEFIDLSNPFHASIEVKNIKVVLKKYKIIFSFLLFLTTWTNFAFTYSNIWFAQIWTQKLGIKCNSQKQAIFLVFITLKVTAMLEKH